MQIFVWCYQLGVFTPESSEKVETMSRYGVIAEYFESVQVDVVFAGETRIPDHVVWRIL